MPRGFFSSCTMGAGATDDMARDEKRRVAGVGLLQVAERNIPRSGMPLKISFGNFRSVI